MIAAIRNKLQQLKTWIEAPSSRTERDLRLYTVGLAVSVIGLLFVWFAAAMGWMIPLFVAALVLAVVAMLAWLVAAFIDTHLL